MTAPAAATGNIRVVARVRPLAKYELANGSKEVVSSMNTLNAVTDLNRVKDESYYSSLLPTSEPELLQVISPGGGPDGKRWFELDGIFDKTSTQREVYIQSGARRAVCEDIFKGFNCTILAYGQTGAGKTFSMGTAAHGTELRETDGIIPRACSDLFETIKVKCDGEAKVTLSYLEIYNEEIRDLLTEDSKPEEMRIRETLDGTVYVSGLTQREVKSPLDIGNLMEEASTRRVVAATAMNATSSRSHAICVLRIAGVLEDADKFNSKLTLVDLAGSERIKKTGAQGNRRQEGININKGLFVLGQVVSALAEQRKKFKRKPPYRDSKLTRLLQDSLGGNSRTIMVACVSPADFNLDESINTLRYATSARNIKNTATRNVIKSISPEEAAKLQRENQLLKNQVKELTGTIERMTVEALEMEKSTAATSAASSIADEDEEMEEGEQGEQIDEAEQTKNAPAEEEKQEPRNSKKVGFEVEEKQETEDNGDAPDEKKFDDKGRIKQLESELGRLKMMLKTAKSDIRKSVRESIQLPSMKMQMAAMQDEVDRVHELEDENEELRRELDEVKMEAHGARVAAAKLSDFMDQLKSLKGEEIERKKMEYDHMRKEEAWVSFVYQMLENRKDQMHKLSNDFDLVVRVVNSPAILGPAPSTRNLVSQSERGPRAGALDTTTTSNRAKSAEIRPRIPRRGFMKSLTWFTNPLGDALQDADCDPDMRAKLLNQHVDFFNARIREVEEDISAESRSLSLIRDTIRKDRNKLQIEIGKTEFMRESLDNQDQDLLRELTSLLIGPIKSLDD